MNAQQWDTLVAAVRGEDLRPLPTAFIVDSPWLPNWAGHTILDYYADDGVFMEANFAAIRAFPDALLVPRSAVRQTGQLTGLFVVEAGPRARFRLVKIAPYDAERVEVLSGVNPGEKIIAGLSHEIVDGIPVTER